MSGASNGVGERITLELVKEIEMHTHELEFERLKPDLERVKERIRSVAYGENAVDISDCAPTLVGYLRHCGWEFSQDSKHLLFPAKMRTVEATPVVPQVRVNGKRSATDALVVTTTTAAVAPAEVAEVEKWKSREARIRKEIAELQTTRDDCESAEQIADIERQIATQEDALATVIKAKKLMLS